MVAAVLDVASHETSSKAKPTTANHNGWGSAKDDPRSIQTRRVRVPRRSRFIVKLQHRTSREENRHARQTSFQSDPTPRPPRSHRQTNDARLPPASRKNHRQRPRRKVCLTALSFRHGTRRRALGRWCSWDDNLLPVRKRNESLCLATAYLCHAVGAKIQVSPEIAMMNRQTNPIMNIVSPTPPALPVPSGIATDADSVSDGAL